MPNRNYEKGVRAERLLKKELEAAGYVVIRASGSHGPFDLVAVHPNRPKEKVRLIQVKSGAAKVDLEAPMPDGDHFKQELWIRQKGGWKP